MAPRRRIAAFAAATALACAPAGLASTPSSTQYGNQLTQESPGQVLGDEAGDGLPFTGLQAGLILVGGLTLAVGGLALRRLGRDRT